MSNLNIIVIIVIEFLYWIIIS